MGNYKHTLIYKIYNPSNPNEVYLTTTSNSNLKPKLILKYKYKSNTENSKRGFKQFFKCKNLKIEYMNEMNLRTHSEVMPHLYMFCKRMDKKYTVINKPKLLL